MSRCNFKELTFKGRLLRERGVARCWTFAMSQISIGHSLCLRACKRVLGFAPHSKSIALVVVPEVRGCPASQRLLRAATTQTTCCSRQLECGRADRIDQGGQIYGRKQARLNHNDLSVTAVRVAQIDDLVACDCGGGLCTSPVAPPLRNFLAVSPMKLCHGPPPAERNRYCHPRIACFALSTSTFSLFTTISTWPAVVSATRRTYAVSILVVTHQSRAANST